jgi:myosin-3
MSTTQGNIVHRKAPSLGSQFKNSLSDLVAKMNGAFPHFVRCIKPNQAQKPSNFDADFVRAQLSYTGVLEATRIRQEVRMGRL